jgi:hypothetical protein
LSRFQPPVDICASTEGKKLILHQWPKRLTDRRQAILCSYRLRRQSTRGIAVNACRIAQTGHRDAGSLAALDDRRHAMQRSVRQKTLRNYRELLAHERTETERRFIAAVLARKERENRQRSSRGWLVEPALVPFLKSLSDIFPASEPATTDRA